MYLAVDFDGAAQGKFGGHAHHDLVVGLQGKTGGLNQVVVAVHLEGDQVEFGWFIDRKDHTEHFHAVVGGAHREAAGVVDEVFEAHRGVVGEAVGVAHGPEDAELAYGGVGAVIVDVELVAGLQELVAGFVELDAQVGHLVGVEQVAAEDVGFVVGGG